MMDHRSPPILIGDTPQKRPAQDVQGEYVAMLGERFYRIRNYDALEPFSMSIVSGSDHWLFISSTGGLTAGRGSAEQALFPYYTVDKLTENSENTGAKTILLVTRARQTWLWEPFSERQRGVYQIERSIYKNIAGTVVLFEEHNHSLGLTYRYAWRTSETFGFVKTAWLHHVGDTPCQVELVDGLQNILPANVAVSTQNIFSPLLDAYKRSEVDPETGLAILALNSTLTDLAEPSESLLATTVFQIGLDPIQYLLSSKQLDRFRAGMGVAMETEVRGQRGAYFVYATLRLLPGAERSWHLLADVGQDSAAIVLLDKKLRGNQAELLEVLGQDIAANQANLTQLVASADGLQVSGDRLGAAHHFANVLFNVMRGGVFADQYRVHRQDFIEFVAQRNRTVLEEGSAFFSALPVAMDILDLGARAEAYGSEDVVRLTYAYLPLWFSRRHGDPSRPWNRFVIDIKRADGSRRLGYEGNWRDIFQNWEALAYSYPEYVESMICTFLNATTADGYNPYRITNHGIDWELPEPNNPWANIGYWGDHQIVYLQKLLEISTRVHPGKLQDLLVQPIFSYADVPYRIKPYAALQRDPYNTIDFDWELERAIAVRVAERGADGRLVCARNGRVLHVTLAEKLLTLLLAKLTNLVPEGGIWMNTQRPEWNDANNALAGKGLSVVTLGYLRRTLVFCRELLAQSALRTVPIGVEVEGLFRQVLAILRQFQDVLAGPVGDEQRRAIMDALGRAGSDYRWNYYAQGFSGARAEMPRSDFIAFLALAQRYVEHSLRANRRDDNLYHAYNVLHLDGHRASISHLYEMLEGQVAILSSELLTGAESLALLESLRNSSLYCADQHTYLLYPDRELPGFLEKNRMAPTQVQGLALVAELIGAKDRTLIIRDVAGIYHFAGHIRNVKDVTRALEALRSQARYAGLVEEEAARIEGLFEEVFRHREFTGRSGTFFAYEGLGSVYWHMVGKLLLAVQETILRTREEASTEALVAQYADIRRGLGFNRTPAEYGAFPSDPYSHTPRGQGAKQPGMTGLVKEEILTRQAELGLFIENGNLVFDFLLLDRNEFLADPAVFAYWSVAGQSQQIELPAGTIAYTFCQVPVILRAGGGPDIQVWRTDGSSEQISGHTLDAVNSRHILQRDGMVHHLVVSCGKPGEIPRTPSERETGLEPATACLGSRNFACRLLQVLGAV
jgi:hypothetical protein